MNLTFLIGNGFDRQCGLKCSYSELYEKYIDSNRESESAKTLKKHFISSVGTELFSFRKTLL